MRKIFIRQMLCLLSAENKRKCMVASEALLVRIHRTLNEYLHQFVTVNKTWIHYYASEMKEQSKQWIIKEKPTQKKAKL